MSVDLLSVPLGSTLDKYAEEEGDKMIGDRFGQKYMQGDDTKFIACFRNCCFLEDILFAIGHTSKRDLPCDWHGLIALRDDVLDDIIDDAKDCQVNLLYEACRQAKQHIRDHLRQGFKSHRNVKGHNRSSGVRPGF